MRKYLLIGLLAGLGAFFVSPSANAVSLKVAPLEYRTELKPGEKKKGFIDVSNPTDQKIVVKSGAEGFRQVDNEGSLQFFKNEQIASGIKLDLKDFELGPKEAVRMYFQLDGSKLPTGDVFGAIFFTTEPAKATIGVGQSIRLGTLFSIVNGTAGSREAEVTKLNVPWLQLGRHIEGSYSIKNTANPNSATGFYPTPTVSVQPFGGSSTQKGKLVFAGIERSSSFSQSVFPIGIYRVSVSFGDSQQSKWVLVLNPAGGLVLLGVGVIAFALIQALRSRRKSKT